jgi:hypothetical protein
VHMRPHVQKGLFVLGLDFQMKGADLIGGNKQRRGDVVFRDAPRAEADDLKSCMLNPVSA